MRRATIRWCTSIILIGLIIYSIYYLNQPVSYIVKEGYQVKNIFHFHCRFHYGDNIVNLKFFYNISSILKENNIMIRYYYDTQQIKNSIELERYVDKETLTLLPLSDRPPDSVELWMGTDINGINHGDFDVYFREFYTRILSTLHLENKGIDVSLYQKEDYLLDIYESLDSKYKDLYILILNSETQSGQLSYNKDTMDAMSKTLASKYKVATSTCVDDSINCTMRDNLTIQDIGAISTHAKYIVAVYSGPLIACFNTYSKDHIKKWIFLVKNPIKMKEINYMLFDSVENVPSTIEEEMTK